MQQKPVRTISQIGLALVLLTAVVGVAGCRREAPTPTADAATATPLPTQPGAVITVITAQELELLEPVSGAEVGATPTLRWKTLPGVGRYQLWVIDAGTTELAFDLVITDAAEAEHVVVLPPLTPGRPYAWQVQGLDAAGNLLAQGDSKFTVAPVGASAEPPECAGAFERRELSEPYQRHRDDEPRYTLSADELDAYLAAMGIQSLCIPVELGAPFVNVDWDSAQGTATTGRMISLGFEGLYRGAGWSDGFVLYSTYDFATGSEYDTFATPADRDAVRSGALENVIQVDSARGFVRFKPSGYGFGPLVVYKSYVFPFETYYVAVVYSLGQYDADTDWDTLVQDIKGGAYPPERQATVARIDALVATLTFDPWLPGMRRPRLSGCPSQITRWLQEKYGASSRPPDPPRRCRESRV